MQELTNGSTDSGDEYLSVTDVAEMCHVAPRTVRRWLKEGEFPGTRRGLGKTSPYRIPRDEVEAFIARRVKESGFDEEDIEEILNHGMPATSPASERTIATARSANLMAESSA